jgi:3',5'-cyclic-AMP phosphodiesterase
MPDDILLRFVHLTDTHINPNPAYNVPEAVVRPSPAAIELVRRVNALPFQPDFILHTGDVVYDPDEAAYVSAREILSTLKAPVYYLAGNHDRGAWLQSLLLQRAEVLDPFDYEFEVNGVQVVCVDSNRPNDDPNMPQGVVSEAQLAWLRGVCRPDDPRPLIVAVHHNVLPTGTWFWDTFMRLKQGEAFHAALLPARDRLRGVFSGHVHHGTDTLRDGILYVTAPSSWYQLANHPLQQGVVADLDSHPGFNVVSITRSQTYIQRYRYPYPL